MFIQNHTSSQNIIIVLFVILRLLKYGKIFWNSRNQLFQKFKIFPCLFKGFARVLNEGYKDPHFAALETTVLSYSCKFSPSYSWKCRKSVATVCHNMFSQGKLNSVNCSLPHSTYTNHPQFKVRLHFVTWSINATNLCFCRFQNHLWFYQIYLFAHGYGIVTSSCRTLYDPTDGSLPVSSVCGTL